MTFAPNTIEHLGVRMYSTLPPVLAEIISNAYDADSTTVSITLIDEAEDKEIVIADDGLGMSFTDINAKFLTIGRNRRVHEKRQETEGGRKVIGKKGLGKLAFFGIAHEIEISTVQDSLLNVFVMRWSDIVGDDPEASIRDYKPEILDKDIATNLPNGTKVTLRQIQRKTAFDPDAIADSISRFFILDGDFEIKIKHNNLEWIEISGNRRFENIDIQLEWSSPEDVSPKSDYAKAHQIVGRFITTKKPISPNTNMRGITLFSRKKLVNLPEYFSDSTSSHFFSYLTGSLEVDFIDDLDEDVIGTSRQSLNWDHPEMQSLRDHLQATLNWLQVDWRAKRKEKREEEIDQILDDGGMTIREWKEKVPEGVRENLTPVIESIVGQSELDDQHLTGAMELLKKLIPPYTYYHYQNLHRKLSLAVFDYYKDENYYHAVFEGVKRYISEVESVTNFKNMGERELLQKVFNTNSPELHVSKKFKRPDGSNFREDTVKNIKEGHYNLVLAVWAAFRNPISHESVEDLRDSGLYTEQDCLDALGLLSHLFHRLENSEVP